MYSVWYNIILSYIYGSEGGGRINDDVVDYSGGKGEKVTVYKKKGKDRKTHSKNDGCMPE